MSVDECIEAYTSMSDRIFQKKAHRVKNWKGEVQGRFDTQALETFIKQKITEKGLPEDALLHDPRSYCCKV